MGGGETPEPSPEQVERASAALIPFVQRWRLSLNPENLDEMAYAALRHGLSRASFEEIDEAVRKQIAEFDEKYKHGGH